MQESPFHSLPFNMPSICLRQAALIHVERF